MDPILRSITTIIVHCADSPNGRPQTVEDIDSWHVQRGFCRNDYWRKTRGFNPFLVAIGYHFVIYLDGTVHTGRHPDEIGAHVEGHNTNTIGICLIGKDKFSVPQWNALKQLVPNLLANIKNGPHQLDAKVMGHRQFDTAIAQGKTCPNFDVQEWFDNAMSPDTENILVESEVTA